jgi:hypothetical protein
LRDYFAEEWESAYFPEDTLEQIDRLTHQAGGESEIVVRVIARITRLIPA